MIHVVRNIPANEQTALAAAIVESKDPQYGAIKNWGKFAALMSAKSRWPQNNIREAKAFIASFAAADLYIEEPEQTAEWKKQIADCKNSKA